MSVESSLPKLKNRVKLPVAAGDKEKSEKAAAPKKTEAKASTTKVAKSAKAPAKAVKAAPAKKAETKTTKAAKPAAKPAKAAPKSAKKGAALTNEGVANAIANAVNSGKVGAAGKVDYASSESVLEALTSKAASVLLKAYSDKAISAVTHGDTDVAKAIKEVVLKNATSVRATAVVKHAKKMAPSIVKAVKAAEAGKLTASDFRGIVFAV